MEDEQIMPRDRDQEKKDFSNKVMFGVVMILLSTIVGILLSNVLEPPLEELNGAIQLIVALGIVIFITIVAIRNK